MLAGVLIAATWHVPSEVATIQEAIDVAKAGDVVIVASGRYFEHVDFRGKALAVQGAGPSTTVLDGGRLAGSVVTFQNAEGRGSVLEGFTLRGGCAALGGGLHVAGASPTIRLCRLAGNQARTGGAVYVDGGEPLLDRCVIEGNSAREGRGIWAAAGDPVLVACILGEGGIVWGDGQVVSVGGQVSPSGACCLDGACVVTTAAACWQAGGSYMGDSSTCQDACSLACSEDVSGDGLVNATDLLLVLGAWGWCP